MGRFLFYGWMAAEGTYRVDQFIRTERSTAFFTLVAICTIESAVGASPLNIPVGEKCIGLFVKILLCFFCLQFAGIVQLSEEILRSLVMQRGAGAVINVKNAVLRSVLMN